MFVKERRMTGTRLRCGPAWDARQIAVLGKFGDFPEEVFVVSRRFRLTRLEEEDRCTNCSREKASSPSRVKRFASFRNKTHLRKFLPDSYLSPTPGPACDSQNSSSA